MEKIGLLTFLILCFITQVNGQLVVKGNLHVEGKLESHTMVCDSCQVITGDGDIKIDSFLKVIGPLDITNLKIDLDSSGVISNESNENYITSSGSGYIRSLTDIGPLDSIEPGNLRFKISSGLSGLGLTEIRRFHVQENTPSGGKSLKVVWQVEASASHPADISLRYLNHEWSFLDNGPEEDLLIWYDSFSYWKSSLSLVVDTALNALSATGVGNINNLWTIAGSGVNPLPVNLTSQDISCLSNESILVSWVTAQEVNNKEFQIMGSKNGFDWSLCGTVAGAGNSQMPNSYKYILFEEYTYVKIIQYDFDGMFEGFPVMVSRCSSSLSRKSFYPYPNPTSSGVWIGASDPINYRVVDGIGKEINSGISTYVDMSDIKTGIYVIFVGDIPHKIIKN
jgi:hypothetical protein